MLSRQEISELIDRYMNSVYLSNGARIPAGYKIIEDTSEFFNIDYNDVLILSNKPYLVRQCAKEGRFGIDEQDKFWVRHAVDLVDGNPKIIKMPFHEKFTGTSGERTVDFNRSSSKEARILRKTRGHPNFMQGFNVKDKTGHTVRIIDFIKGKTWSDYIVKLGSSHEDYYYNHFMTVFEEFIELVEAIAYIHHRGEIHGDIRRDHIIREMETGINKWIDFDLSYIIHGESHFLFDLLSLGNLLAFAAGRGDVTVQNVQNILNLSSKFNQTCNQTDNQNQNQNSGTITSEDLNINFRNRIINLKKIYPYISGKLNDILLRFSCGAKVSYDGITQFIDDLKEIEIL
ncbi:MAG: serine/threonine protein kinase [Nitrospirae bacterium]|nr:serine/threonine protein kinase [Nitrospirota bacterium]